VILVKVRIFPGRKLDYELRHNGKRGNEMNFLTAVEFSIEEPYGKAVALLDLRSRHVTVPYFLPISNIFYRGTFLFFIS